MFYDDESIIYVDDESIIYSLGGDSTVVANDLTLGCSIAPVPNLLMANQLQNRLSMEMGAFQRRNALAPNLFDEQ